MDGKKAIFFEDLKKGDVPRIKQHIKDFSTRKEGLNFTFHEASKWSHTPLIVLTRPNFSLGDDGPFLRNITRQEQIDLLSLCLENGADPQFGTKILFFFYFFDFFYTNSYF